MATKNVFDRFDQPSQPEQPKKAANVFDNFDGQTKATSAARYLADTGVAGAQGLVSGVQMLANVAGADNAVSRTLGGAAEKLGTLQSPYRKAEQQNRQRLIDKAEQSGSMWEEVKANVSAFAEAPIDTTVNALGTSAPTMAAAMLTGGAAAPVVLGAAQGAGAVKGAIYDSVASKLKETGVSEEEARRRAGEAQAYTSDNAAQIALGAGLGAAAGATGAESAIARMASAAVGKKAGKEVAQEVAKEAGDLTMGSVAKAAGVGALKEAPMEMLQGGQERVAGNIALQNEGFDTPTFQGAVGQAALEGLASAPIGGGFGAMERLSQVQRPGEPAPEPPKAPPPALGYNPSAGTIAVFPDGSAILNSETPAGEAQVFEKRFAPQPVKPSEAMGINPGDGVISSVAAQAVDTGVTSGIQAAEQAAMKAQQAEEGQPAQEELPLINLEDADENDRLAYQAYMASLADDEDADAMVRDVLGDDPDVTLDAPNNTSEEDFLRALGASDQEIADALAANPAPSRQPTAADAGADAAAGTGSAIDGLDAGRPADAGAAATPGPDLTAASTERPAGAAPNVPADPKGSTQQSAQSRLSQLGNVQDAPQGAAGGATAQAAPVEAPAPAAGNAAAPAGVPDQGRAPDVQAAGVSQESGRATAMTEATAAAKTVIQQGGSDQDAMRAATNALISRMGSDPGISIATDAPAAVRAAKSEAPAPTSQITKAELDKLEVPNMTDDQLRAGAKLYGAVTKRATKIRKEIQKRGLDAQPPAPKTEKPNGPQAPQAQQAAPQGREETTLLPDPVSAPPAGAPKVRSQEQDSQPPVEVDAAGRAERRAKLTGNARWDDPIAFRGMPEEESKAQRKVVEYMNGDITRTELLEHLEKSGLSKGRIYDVTQRLENDAPNIGEVDAMMARREGGSLEDQLARVNDELASQGMVKNAATRAKRDQIRKAIAERDFPAILNAVDGAVEVAEDIHRALQYSGSDPKAQTIERVLKKRGITDEYRKRWSERLLANDNQAQEPAGTVVIPADEAAFAEALNDLMGEDERESAMFKPAGPTVALPRVTAKNPQPAGLPFISAAEAAERLQAWKDEAARQGAKAAPANAQRTVISLFDASGVISQPWVDAGYNVISYDLQNGDDISQFNAEALLERHGNDNVWAILAQPPCTDFASSGAQWWKEKDADGRTEASNELVRQTLRTVELFRPAVWVMENPVGRIATQNNLPDPTLTFDPWAYGDPYTKRTQLWGRFDPNLPTAPVEPTEGSKIHRLSSTAKYERSLTPEGFAYALFMANNAESMSPAARLAQEFAGVDAAMFKGAIDAGNSPESVRTAIEDAYNDGDLDTVREELQRMAGDTPPANAASAPGAQEYTQADAAAAESQLAQMLGNRIDAMQAQAVQAIAARFLPTMGVKTPVGKAKIKAAVTDFTRVNPLAAASEFGVELSDSVKRALEAKSEGRLEAAQAPKPKNTWEITGASDFKEGKPRELPSYFTDKTGPNAKAWLRGWDSAKAEATAAPSQQADTAEFMKAMEDARKELPDGFAIVAEPKSVALKEGGRYAVIGLGRNPAGVAEALRQAKMRAAANAAVPAPAPEAIAAPAPAPAPADALTEREKAAKAKMFNALGKLAALASKNTRMNWTQEEEQQLLPIVIELFDGAMELGAVKFKRAVAYVREFIANGIDQETADSIPFETLQGAYIAVAGRHKDKPVTPKKEVAGFESLDELNAQEDNDTPENTNGQPSVRQPGAQALDPAPTQQGGGAAPGGNAGAGPADRGKPGAGADSGADGAGLQAPRGGGSRPSRVPSAASRGGRSGGRRGTGADGTRVPRNDARTAGAAGAAPEPVSDLFAGDAESASAPNIPATNFQIDESLNLGSGGEAAKFRDNIAAIETLKAIEAERRRATPEEQRILARFVGWGGLASAFPNPETGKFKDGWQEKGEQLRNLLTPSEYRAASRSTRNAHYTSSTVVKAMWSAVHRLGYRNGLALETSMGVGNFLGLMPGNVAARFIGVEYDALTARMAKALYPQATVLQSGFQEVPLPDNVFDLSIGNPPFGDESLRFQYRPELRGQSIHNQFFRASMSAVKPGGLQAMVVSRYLMDKQDRATRVALAREAALVAAIRLPDTAFKENARTEVVTDIIILRKRTPADRARMEAILDAYTGPKEKAFDKERERQELAAQAPAWIETTEIPDPLGGEPMVVNSYFRQNPGQVVGVMERSGSMRYKNDVTVRLDDPASLGDRLDALVAKLPENIVSAADDVAQATEQNYKLLGEALSMAVAKEEAGHIKFDEDGGLTRAVEREFGTDVVLTRQPLTAQSPWSKQLFVDDKGRWYKLEVKTDNEGKPVKVIKDGKATNRNVYDRTVYENEADIPNTLRLGETGFARLKGLVGLRDLLKRQLVLETEDAPKVMMEGNRSKLAKAYEAFVAEHGPINRRANAALVTEMPDGGLILALEESYEPERTAAQAKKSGLPEQKESAKPAPIMRERVVPKYEPPTKAETPADALAITLAERGIVDVDRIAALLEISPEEAAERLQAGEKPLIFKDPETGVFETSDAYLSGHVRRKLIAARAAGLQKNVAALEAIQPERWGAENVTAQMGSTWIPADVYADFGKHLFGGNVKVNFSAPTNTFSVSATNSDPTKAETWGSEGAPAAWIFNRLLNSQSPIVTRVDSEGKTYVDKESTSLAILKSREMVAEFGDWVFKEGERRERLVEIFNEKFNTRVTRQFDGSHLKLPGKVPDSIIKMRRHQMNAIWRGISSRFLLIDHVVGAGKTFTAIARAMERRRMGLAQKPAIVVPNHLIEQWQADVYKLYPGAKVLAASKADFEAKNRRKLFSRIATGDYDVVILPHSSLVKIGISPETEQRYLEQELQEAIQAVKDAEQQAKEDGYEGFRKPMGVKEAERLVAKIEARMAKLREGATDRLLTFEQLGIDDLTVDEAHEFKNLFYSSRMTGTRGMGDKTGSLKASDLYNKVRVLRDNAGSVVFMTGTPVSNSVVELYTMMRYLASSDLRDMGMEHFDAWRAQFVEATPAFEPDEANRLKEVTRLGRTWSNMRSMMDLYYQFTDAVSIDDIKKWYAEDNGGKAFPVPKVKGGDRQLVKMVPTKAQDAMLKEVLAGFDGLEGIKDPKERNAERLRLMDRARKLSLDARAADRRTTSTEQGGKLERVSAEVKRIYDKWTADRGTQLIFLDRSVPKAKGDDKIIKDYDALMAKRDKALMDGDDAAFQEVNEALEKFDANEIEELRNAQNGGWNAYQQIKDNLVASGIPADEIRFVQEANTDEQKQALFDAVKGGRVRVLIGSTPRMGAGTNVQDRLVALHHVDVTWKPSDIEQREGRIIRQGNLFSTPPTAKDPNPLYKPDFEVEIMAYATERTVDAKMWSLNATKLKAINGLRKYTGDFTMEVEDEESVSMAEMAALASGNPLLLERVTLESAINGLELQERAFRRKMYGAQDALRSAEEVISTYPARIESTRQQAKQLAAVVQSLADRADARRVTIEGKEYATLKDALIAVKAAVDEQQAGNENARYAVSVNGERLTNKAAIEDAIGRALGDAEAFEVDIGGATFTQRTAAGREAAAKLSPLAAQDRARGTLGTMFGMKLSYEFAPARYDQGKVNLVLALEDEAGKTMASTEISQHDPNIQFTTSKMRDALGSLAAEVESKAIGQSVGYMEDRLERAQRDLPTLKARLKETFPKAQELIDKRRRLNEVVTMLTSGVQEEGQADTGPANLAQTGAMEGNTADVVFSRGAANFSPAAREQAVGAVQSQVDRIMARLANPPKVVVAFDLNDPRIPAEIRAEDQKQRSGGARGTPEGFYYRGTAYIMASQMKTPADTARVFAHEVLGHYGLRGLFGKQLRPILQQVIMSRPQEVAAKMREYGLRGVDSIDKMTAAEEVLAELAQSEPQLGIVRRAVAAIRTWLRETIPGLGGLRMSNDEIIRSYILPARDFVARGREAAGRSMPVARVAFQRGQGQGLTQTAAFRRWFGDSKVVDAQGRPLVVYHGTNADEDFTAFKGPKIYFSPDPAYASGYADGGMIPGFPIKNSRVMPVYLSVQKPLDLRDMGARQVERGALIKRLEAAGVSSEGIASIERNTDDFPMFLWTWMHENSVRLAIQDAGFDAVFQQESNGGQTGDAFIVFKPEQIKSAIGNNGDFDPANPDIRFSRSAPVSPRSLVSKANDQLKMAMSAPGKLSWWHKTIGTMNNLAERNPAFKRVFQTAQAFIDDVSYYATEAADLAPKILPKLEAWRDIAKSPISAADNRAISAPIFEGTLNWARDESGKAVPVADLVEAASRMTVDQKARRLLRQDKISEGVLKMWQGLPLDQYEQMVNSRYESQMLAAGVVWTDDELRSMWKLTPEQIGLYKEFRAATDKSLDNLTRADMLRFGGADVADLKDAVMEAESASAAATLLADHLRAMADTNPDRSAQLMASANGMIDRSDRLAKLQAQGYAPLSRFGKYSVDVVVDGERQYFGLFETAMDANKMAAKMRAEFGKEAVSQGTLSNEAFKMFAGVTPETLELFGNMLGLDSTGDEVRDQLFQDYLKLTKNNRSAMKRLIHRKGIAGYSEDVGRVLASFIYSNARQTAAGLHMGELGKAVTDIPKSQGELKDEAVRLAEYIKNPQEEAQAIRGLLFAQYLGGSIASAFVNMTQPLAVSFPYLSQFGGASKAGAQMTRAIKDVASGKANYEKDLAEALKRAEEDGTVSPQEVHQLMAQARGSATLRAGDGTKLGEALATGRNHFSRLMLGWGKVFGVAEQFNRRSTFIAAYRIAKEQKIANPAEFAKKAVQETQFIYSKANKMRWGRGAVGGTLMTFKTYSIAYLELLHRMYTQGGPEGKRAALLAVAVLMLMSGVGGLPFMEDAEDIADGVAQVFGYNISVKKVKEEMLESVFGQAGADFIQRGISGLPGVPLDVSGRLGLGNLIPGTGAFQQKTSYTRDVAELAGPAGDLAGRTVNAARMAVGGDLAGALLELSPVAIRNMAKGADMASTGMYRDAKGFKVIDTTGPEAALKGIGFQPSTVAKVQEANYLNQRAKDFYNLTAQRIRAKWARGVFEKNQDMVDEARAELADWNAKNPDQRMLPNLPAIMRKVREMGKSKDQRIADTAPKAMRQQMREETARMRENL